MFSNKLFIALIFILLTSACSSTLNKDYSVIERPSEKRALISDHHLKMSLLNRPIPQDQLMMMAFARTQETYKVSTDHLAMAKVSYVSIRGSYEDDAEISANEVRVNDFVANDINAISVLGPK